MGSDYKRIILLKGLEVINEYQFSIVKSLLARDLGLTANMQEEYNKVRIADLMEKKFPGPACVDKLIDLFKDMPPLKDIVKQLRNEKMKVAKKTKTEETPKKKRQQGGAGPTPAATATSSARMCDTQEGTATFQKRKTATKGTAATKKNKVAPPQSGPVGGLGGSTFAAVGSASALHTGPVGHLGGSTFAAGRSLPQPQASASAPFFPGPPQNQMVKGPHQAAPRGRVLQQGPLTVLVLKATEPFEYESPEEGKTRMFHATVATPTQFFHVKVLNSNLKEKFTKENIITILDYYECKGILEINKTSSVFEADPFQLIVVPNSIIKRANETPKIDNLYKQASGTFVYGLFLLYEKKVNRKTTVYEIQDSTGTMEVVGNERWHNIKCEKGDKLRLFCFQLKTIDQKLKLTCGTHSFIQVVKARKSKKEPVNFDVKVEFDMMNSPLDQFMDFNSGLVKTEDFY
ncbi:myeloid cell nuclear differentiation antigen-like [Meles meles]|uniref:myeloid cell nuclear differentiation antigen-like n=1 Tax=Meles meles TaxID=9662 RepID=UPI001E69C4D1|nr:myeloid cell nuclear differentiation antigen-like [Meles meles]XP_045838314.1 myeloid cell nuclear differentiation antigen-like [Meles meles]XP_045838315.1 myeloid cell nuclear differentiation antigen-like [Meles meles]